VQKFGERAFGRHFCLVDKHVRTEDRIQATTGRRQNYFQGTSYYCDIAMNFNMSSGLLIGIAFLPLALYQSRIRY
jgi:hypothetical protein